VKAHEARWWREDGERILCTLCPKACRLKDGQRGFCYLRFRDGDKLYTDGYGTTSGMAIDPIEKKPLNHFLPTTKILSLGNMGCNLACKFCQNWNISKARETPLQQVSAQSLADLAKKHDTPSIAFTYNDPTIWAEFITDASWVLKENGIHPVLVTAGYIEPEARKVLYEPISAINFDLKAFTEDFYFRVTNSHLKDVLETLIWTRENTDIWMELTTLIIPGKNDSDQETYEMLDWIAKYLGVETPLHFTAFHPDWKMMDTPRTPLETLQRKYEQAREKGFPYVYLGNVSSEKEQSTYCPGCNAPIISRTWHQVEFLQNEFQGQCQSCARKIPGVFN
jgi:pyruvate formate lyase activating enzyme